MSSLIYLRQKFKQAARTVALDDSLQDRPSLRIEDATFRNIFGPVAQVFEEGRIYAQNKPLDIPEMIEELRSMVLEAQTTHSTKDGSTRERRTDLLNILQSIKERAEEGVDIHGMRAADMDFFSLQDLTDVIREAALTHSEYLHNDDIAQTLMSVAQNVETAHKHLWHPTELPQFATADDYGQEDKEPKPKQAHKPTPVIVHPEPVEEDDYVYEGIDAA